MLVCYLSAQRFAATVYKNAVLLGRLKVHSIILGASAAIAFHLYAK